MTRPARVVKAALAAKGMEPADAHHKMFRKKVDGVITLITRVSHGTGDIGTPNCKKMAAQCALSLGEFRELVDCTMSAERWDELVRERCAGGRNPYISR